jgi:hypothetical protein
MNDRKEIPKDVTRVNIDSNVTEIPAETFSLCGKLKNVNFSEATELETIGELGFSDCVSLTSVKLSPNTIVLKKWSFLKCLQLQTVMLNDKLVEIPNRAFMQCENLTCVDFTGAVNLTTIGEGAFANCPSLMSLALAPNVMNIKSRAFFGCSHLKEVQWNAQLVNIGNESFQRCIDLETVDMTKAERLERVGEKAFFKCSSLRLVKLAPYLKLMEYAAFSDCDELREVHVNESLVELPDCAFMKCFKLHRIDFAMAASLTKISSGSFLCCTSLKAVKLPQQVKTIGKGAFTGCHRLSEVCLNDGLETLGRGVFSSCTDLKRLTVPATINYFDDPFRSRHANLERIDIRENKNLPLALRLVALYPDATPSISMDRMLFLYSFHRIKGIDLLMPHEDSSRSDALTREQEKLTQLRIAYPETIRRLVVWCIEKGIIRK